MTKEQLVKIRGQADAAMAALCSVPIQGPAIIPIGRAMEAVSALAAERLAPRLGLSVEELTEEDE